MHRRLHLTRSGFARTSHTAPDTGSCLGPHLNARQMRGHDKSVGKLRPRLPGREFFQLRRQTKTCYQGKRDSDDIEAVFYRVRDQELFEDGFCRRVFRDFENASGKDSGLFHDVCEGD